MSPGRNEHSRVEDLLREGAWVRALARRLVADESAADDVVQDTWFAALRSAPVEDGKLRPWLARVVRNFALSARRTEANRAAREAEAARREPARSAADTVERLEAQRELVDALAALDEPYRTTILRRYFDGLSAADIARDDGLPAATVRWRIAHGLGLLRARLDQRYGDRASWGLAFLPLTRTPTPVAEAAAGASGVATLGVLTMSTVTRMTIAAMVVLTASLGTWLVVDAHDVDEPSEVVASGASATLTDPLGPTEAPGDELVRAEDPGGRAEMSAAARPAAGAAADRAVHIDGRFVDAQGNGIAGVRILEPLREDGEVVLSDARGDFALPIGPMPAAVLLPFEARAEGWAAHFADVPIAPGTTVHLGPIVLKPGGTVVGRVIDETGAPVAGARILTTSPVLTDEAASLQRTGPQFPAPERKPTTAVTRSDADGSFRLEGVPAETLRVWAGHADRRWAFSEPVEVPAAGVVRDVVLELAPLAADDVIDGVVLDPDGQPVARAILNYGFHAPEGSHSNSTRTDRDGRFEIPVIRKLPHRLHVSAPRNQWPAIALKDVAPGTRGLVIRMRAGIPIDLFVVDEKGEPIEGFEYTVSAEGHGSTRRADADSNGRVVIGMPAMPFTVEVTAPGRARAELGPIDPAAPPDALRCTLEAVPGLRGRVLADGKPVAGAEVALHRIVGPDERVEIEGFPTRLHGSPLEKSTTDEAGRFLITAQESGTFALLCEAQGYARVEISPLPVDPRAEREEIAVNLTRGGAIEGRVLVPEGRDAAGIIVGITRFDGRPRTVRVAADGRFRFENLSPGGWRVTRSNREIRPNRSSSYFGGGSRRAPSIEPNCIVEDGVVTTFDLDLREVLDAVLVGHIAVNGQAAAGWTVRLTPEDVAHHDEPPAGIVSASGDVRIVLPRPAPYRLDLVPPSESGAPLCISRQIAILGGENPFAADVECGALEGVVTGDRGRHQLSCRSVDGAEWSVDGILTWGDDGRFRVSHLPTGAARIRLWDTRAEDGYRTVADLEVDVTRAATTTVALP
ncbi:MAG: sigma-70 family RNA polymerase sigma factor [Planctomycetes bacterium]|nr:sigma-70 family RNA polymerase sigma factor [Planctomycetota bacterium]